MNYGRVNNVVSYSELISLEAKGLYAIVCSLCGNKDYCYPAISTLCKMSGKSKSTIQIHKREYSFENLCPVDGRDRTRHGLSSVPNVYLT